VKVFAPVGNGRVIAYFFARENEPMSYLRGTNVLRVGDAHYAALDDEIKRGEFDIPPLGGATRAAIVERIPNLDDRNAVQALYARSVLVIAQHQLPSGEFIAEPEVDVLMANALDVCGERGAAEAEGRVEVRVLGPRGNHESKLALREVHREAERSTQREERQ